MEPAWINSLVRCRRVANGTNQPRSFVFHPDGHTLYFLGTDASVDKPIDVPPPSTLYAVPIPLTQSEQDDTPIQWKHVLPPSLLPNPTLASGQTAQKDEDAKNSNTPAPSTTTTTTTDTAVTTTAPSTNNPTSSPPPPVESKEAELLRERKRMVAHGLTEYSIHSATRQFVLPLNGAIYVAPFSDEPATALTEIPKPVGGSPPLDATVSSATPKRSVAAEAAASAPEAGNMSAPTTTPSTPSAPPTPTTIPTFLDPKMCPDGSMMAFVRDADLWVVDMASGRERRLTDSRPLPEDTASGTGPEGGVTEPRARTCGVAEYVMCEEFSRYTGYWWAPSSREDGEHKWEILYLAVDQEDIPIVRVAPYTIEDGAEHYHYPRPGDCNAITTPYVIPVPQPPKDSDVNLAQWANAKARDWVAKHAWTPLVPLQQQFPWAEYVVRAGWLPPDPPNATQPIYGIIGFWLALLDRRQQRFEIVAFPSFGEGVGIVLLSERSHDWWINVPDNIRFLSKKRALLHTSERTGCAHLYLKNLPPLGEQIGGPPSPPSKEMLQKAEVEYNKLTPITAGEDWIVEDIVAVDEKRQLIFYTSTKSGPLERQLCVSSYANVETPEKNVHPLSEPGFMITNVKVNLVRRRVVYNYSNRSTDVCTKVFSIDGLVEIDGGTQKLTDISLSPWMTVQNPKLQECNRPPWPTPPPQSFTFEAEDGTTLHGAIFMPHTAGGERKGPFPAVLSVYAGPHVQMVKNERRLTMVLKHQMLAAMGYAVIVIDGRGSYRRGLRFESSLRGRFGGAELRDQVAGVQHLIEKGIVDRSRVAVTGWSYGAFAALMLLARWGSLFRIAVCGAPVTRWEGYDAAYTERYLGLPDENAAGYAASSVVSYAEAFPENNGRLMLVHSLMDENVHASHTVALVDELIKRNKQHALLLFPRERHGLRDPTAQRHFETAFFNFLTSNM